MTFVGAKRFIVQEIVRFGFKLVFFFRSHRSVLLSLALAGGVLAVAPLVGFLIVEVDPLLVFIVLFVPLGLVGLRAALLRFEWDPIIILCAAAFVPISLPTGTESRLVISLVLTILFVCNWVLKMLLEEKRLSLQPSIVNLPLLGFMVTTLVALLWSFVLRDPLVVIWRSFPIVQIASSIVMIMLPGAFLLMANHINDVKLLKIMVGIMIIAGVLGLIRIMGVYLPINFNGLFTMWVVNLSAGLALFHRRLSWKWRGLLLVLVGAWIYFRFFLQITWLAGWLPCFLALGILLFMRSKKLFLAVFIVGVIILALNADYYLGSVINNETNESGNTRMAAWEVNWQVTGKHLLLGTGPAGYAAYYMTYYSNEAMATHNNYIDILAETGIIGFVFNLWFFLALAWLGYKLCLRVRGRGDFVEALANSGLAGTVSCIFIMGFGDWLYPFAYTQTIAGFDYAVYSWLFIGAVPALDRLISIESKASGEEILASKSPGSPDAA